MCRGRGRQREKESPFLWMATSLMSSSRLDNRLMATTWRHWMTSNGAPASAAGGRVSFRSAVWREVYSPGVDGWDGYRVGGRGGVERGARPLGGQEAFVCSSLLAAVYRIMAPAAFSPQHHFNLFICNNNNNNNNNGAGRLRAAMMSYSAQFHSV